MTSCQLATTSHWAAWERKLRRSGLAPFSTPWWPRYIGGVKVRNWRNVGAFRTGKKRERVTWLSSTALQQQTLENTDATYGCYMDAPLRQGTLRGQVRYGTPSLISLKYQITEVEWNDIGGHQMVLMVHGVVSCGMAWYGMIWYVMVWYGMVSYGMVSYGMVWYVMVWYGKVWYGMAWCVMEMVWYGMVCYGNGMVWYNGIRHGMVWYNGIWYRMVWYGMISLSVLLSTFPRRHNLWFCWRSGRVTPQRGRFGDRYSSRHIDECCAITLEMVHCIVKRNTLQAGHPFQEVHPPPHKTPTPPHPPPCILKV